MEIIQSDRLFLYFASVGDMRLAYDMLVDPRIASSMFNDTFPPPTWSEFAISERDYFTGYPSKNGNYLRIEIQGAVIGVISYANGYSKRIYSELDIWLAGEWLGQGFGSEAICRVVDYVHRIFKIDEFIIRPWKRNYRAVRAYKRCGFKEDPDFDAARYYDEETLQEYGEGDYGAEETLNMVLKHGEPATRDLGIQPAAP